MLSQVSIWGMMFLQEAGQPLGWDPVSLWRQMLWPAQTVVVIMLIMSAWSIGVMIDRWLAYSAARKQS